MVFTLAQPHPIPILGPPPIPALTQQLFLPLNYLITAIIISSFWLKNTQIIIVQLNEFSQTESISLLSHLSHCPSPILTDNYLSFSTTGWLALLTLHKWNHKVYPLVPAFFCSTRCCLEYSSIIVCIIVHSFQL